MTGAMTVFLRADADEYSVAIGTADISGIANEIRTVPAEYINAEGNGITAEGIRYLAPLIEGEVAAKYEHGMPKHVII